MTHTIHPARLVAAFTLLGAAIAITVQTSAPWWAIPALLLAPDVSFLAAVGAEPSDAPGAMPPRAVRAYNIAHHPYGPIATILFAALAQSWTIALVSIMWAAHLTWDRAVGYGRRDTDGRIRGSAQAGLPTSLRAHVE